MLFLLSGLAAATGPGGSRAVGAPAGTTALRSTAVDPLRPDLGIPMSLPAGAVERTLVPWAGEVADRYHRTFFWATPAGLAYDPAQGTLWLAEGTTFPNESAPLVYVNATTDDAQGMDLAVTNASALALDPATGNFYVTNPNNDSVWVVNGSDGDLVHLPIPVGRDPVAIAYAANSGDLYVANAGSLNVSVIDPATETTLPTSPTLADVPFAIAYDPVTTECYLSESPDNLQVLNTSTEKTTFTLTVGTDPRNLTVNATDGDVWVADSGSNTVSVIDAKTHLVLEAGLDVGTQPAGILWVPATGDVAVVDTQSDNVTLLNGGTYKDVAASIGLPPVINADPAPIAYDPATGDVYVVGENLVNVTSIDPGTGLVVTTGRSIMLDLCTEVDDPTTGGVFLLGPSFSGADVYEVNATTFAPMGPPVHVPGPTDGAFPWEVGALDPVDQRLFVATGPDENAIAVYNATGTHALLATIPGPGSLGYISEILFDPQDGKLYVSYEFPGGLVEVDPASMQVVTTYSFGGDNPGMAAIDPALQTIVFLRAFYPELFLLNTSANTTAGPVAVPGLGSFPTSIVFDPADALFYITLRNGYVEAYDLSANRTLPHPIPVPGLTGYIAYDPWNEFLYVATQSPSGTFPYQDETNLTVLNGSSYAAAFGPWTVIYTGISVPGANIIPVAPAQAGLPDELWVADAFDGSALVLAVPPLVTSFAAAPAAVDEGSPVAFQADVLGGADSLSYAYSGLPAGCIAGNGPTIDCTPTVVGTFAVGVTVTDALGESASATAALTVAPTLAVSATVAVPSGAGSPSATTTVGTSLSFAAAASGGTAPYTVNWSFGDGTHALGASAAHAFSVAGTYAVLVEVTDALGDRSGASVSVVVNAAGSSPTKSSGSSSGGATWTLALSLLIVGLVAGAVIGVLLGRRGRPPVAPPPPVAPEGAPPVPPAGVFGSSGQSPGPR